VSFHSRVIYGCEWNCKRVTRRFDLSHDDKDKQLVARSSVIRVVIVNRHAQWTVIKWSRVYAWFVTSLGSDIQSVGGICDPLLVFASSGTAFKHRARWVTKCAVWCQTSFEIGFLQIRRVDSLCLKGQWGGAQTRSSTSWSLF